MNEKEAIERVEKYIKSFNGNALDCVAIGTVLTLLEKYKKDYISTSKRTNEYKKAIECEKCNCSVCQAHLNNIELQAELEKKDKIINELEDIFYNYQLCEYELTDCTYRKCEYIADDENPPCKECIKNYFEEKATNDG